MVIRVSFVYTIFQAVVLITRLDFLHVQILKARRTWSMTSFEDTTRRRSKDEDDRVAADHHQHHKDLTS
ncbi:hypothetical protein HanIR_Chr05g0209361 [Helianthus annuus]|nr:hypothetical protein HanIR_Chr05g0209361 [Helianthus annuus]